MKAPMRYVSSRSWITVFLLVLASASHGAVREWDGDAQMNNTWIIADNWAGNVAPNPGDNLLFRTGARHPNNNNNFAPATTFNTIELRGGGGGSGYNITGNSIALNAGLHIENNSTPIDHTLSTPFILNSNQTFFVHNPLGIFSLPGAINLSGKNLTFDITAESVALSGGIISGPGTVTKTGEGTLHLNGIQPATPVSLASGTLKGTGTVGTLTSIAVGAPGAAVLSPGGSPGIFTSSNVALNASTTFSVELNGTTPGIAYDQLRVNGSVSLGSATLSVTLGFGPAVGSSFVIIDNDGADSVNGTFSGLQEGAVVVTMPSAVELRISYAGGDGNDVVLTRVQAPTRIVTNTDDGGPGSLRQAITDANANADLDTIGFNIPGAGVRTIVPAIALPSITTPVIIDGYTQPGTALNTLPNGDNAVLLIELSGAQSGGNFHGLVFTGGGVNSTVRGLAINRFSDAIQFNYGSIATASNVVEGCFIGTDPSGMIGFANSVGIRLFRAAGNRIGGASPAARNIISRNNQALLLVVSSSSNIVQGNFIGTDATGTNVLLNGTGISIETGANSCTIGGGSAAMRNVIAGNGSGTGLSCFSTFGHTIQGNYIGLDVTGTKAQSFNTPVFLSCSSSLVGGLTPVPGTPPGNIIAGGAFDNLTLSPVVNDPTPTGNTIQGNLIGTDAGGAVDLGNGGNGISLTTANNNIVGGPEAGAGNVISGNNNHGISIDGGTNNIIEGNRIGTDMSGASRLGNGSSGVEIRDRANLVRGNVIAFNGGDGINVSGSRATNNLVSRNSVFENVRLGIDLENIDGPESNDIGDADEGPNRLQNYPVITNTVVSLAGVMVQGFLASAPNTAYTLEFFADFAGDRSGFGEGQKFLGSTTIMTDATGTNFFSLTMPSDVTCHFFATATATDPSGNTSEFSRVRQSIGVDTDGDRACDVEEVLAGTLTNNPASVFRITGFASEGNDLRVSWQAGGNRTNMLQATSGSVSVRTTNFVDVPPSAVFPVPGDVTTNRLHIGGATNRAGYYRVRLVR